MGVLEGKVAVITGGSRGLGYAIAEAYAREGAAVVVGSRSEEAVAGSVKRLAADGARATGLPCDAGKLGDVEGLAAHAIAHFGGFDIWVNNAGISAPYGATIFGDPAEFETVVRTNILGTHHGSLVALRHFLPKRRGKLINLLGRGYTGPVANQNAYGASKAWIYNYTRALAKEHKGAGVEVIAFSPGMMLTDLLSRPMVLRGWEEEIAALPTVMRILANPVEVPARRAVWLASPATDGKNGLKVEVLGPGRMLSGLLKEGWRILTRRPLPPIKMEPRVAERAWEP